MPKDGAVTVVWNCRDCGMTRAEPFRDAESGKLTEIRFYPLYHEVMRLHADAMREDGQDPHWKLDIRSCRLSLDYEDGSEFCSGKIELEFSHA